MKQLNENMQKNSFTSKLIILLWACSVPSV